MHGLHWSQIHCRVCCMSEVLLRALHGLAAVVCRMAMKRLQVLAPVAIGGLLLLNGLDPVAVVSLLLLLLLAVCTCEDHAGMWPVSLLLHAASLAHGAEAGRIRALNVLESKQFGAH